MSDPMLDVRESLGTTFKRLIRQLILPSNVGVNSDADAIILDSQPSGCLATRYAAVILLRQAHTSFRGQWFLGVVKNALVSPGTATVIEQGFMLNDGSGTCWIYVTCQWHSDFDPINGNSFSQQVGNVLSVTGTEPAPNPYLFAVIGDFTVFGNITWGQVISDTRQDRQNTSYTSTSTSYTATGAVFCGVAFVAPPSGKMLIHIGGRRNNSGAGTPSNFLGLQVNTGNAVGSGSTVLGVSDDTAVDSASTSATFGGGISYLLTGLTAGANYNAFLLHKVQSGTGTFSRRYVIAEPVL